MKELSRDIAVVFAALTFQLGMFVLIFGVPMTLFILSGNPHH
jgi:hypothetical protein